ncbi:MAG: hypothetical protein KDK36_00915 [Leptospiraceae bacterium]|nr:hypothetical protein [Leptospiraceae bacterium]
MAKEKYIENLLERHIGIIQKYTEQKVFGLGFSLNDHVLHQVFKNIYPLMPDTITIQTSEDEFTLFCFNNLDKILPATAIS